ncbi:MAG TPA: hypothetical protein VGE52_21455 [Pirellulales bacterium]
MAGAAYRIVQFDQPVGSGVSDAKRVWLWGYAKFNQPEVAAYCIPNELICSEIGRFLGLPIPPGAVIHAPSDSQAEYWFASLDFNLSGDSLPAVDLDDCVAQLPDLSTGLLLFDLLVANSDRHDRNFSVDFLAADGPSMSVFDHGHALFGQFPGDGIARLTELHDRLAASGGPVTRGTRHCLMDVLPTCRHFGGWLERIDAIPDFFIENCCRAAIGRGATPAEADAAIEFLKHRRNSLRQIIEANRQEFRAIQQWELLL